MANGNGDGFWKWVATTLGGAIIGASVMGILSSRRVEALTQTIQGVDREQAVVKTQVAAIEEDIDDLAGLLREAIRKMDDYHRQ